MEQEVLVGTEDLVEIRISLERTDRELVETEGESEKLLREIRDLEVEIARMSQQTLTSRRHINRLQSDLKSLDKEQKRLGAEAVAERDVGEKVRRYTGDGDRQYLTGLKVGGKHILILVDASASMLDETVVNVIRRRNMDDARKRVAAKWRRALASTDWLISNLPPGGKFQLYTFDTTASPTLPSSKGKWLSTARREDLEGAVNGLYKVVPDGGTSLYRAFAVAQRLTPKPDNVLLITDGLPTQGRKRPSGTTVTGEQRLKHFLNARQALPSGVPVNTILLPMEGDAYAAAAFWRLALDTRGSMITPARDWP